jgi:hypothetical protein
MRALFDPGEAPKPTARQEVEKINLALELGNTMLYLDDIQHTDSELLQKFISLCDAQRKIEGVWRGQTRTYDLRGKKFCVVMAGNPYTESGQKFNIPDMLANRADTYNLGDILEGKSDLFALSYLENALTSNATLAPLMGRAQDDIYRFIRMAQGESVPTTDLSHGYSAAEISDIIAVLRLLFKAQRVLLQVNQQYIASASQDDAFRTEPGFKLQGSYRNMNKLAERIVPAMNDDELERLIDDHYASEAQTLTTGAEQNLLKLAEIRGRMTGATRARGTKSRRASRGFRSWAPATTTRSRASPASLPFSESVSGVFATSSSWLPKRHPHSDRPSHRREVPRRRRWSGMGPTRRPRLSPLRCRGALHGACWPKSCSIPCPSSRSPCSGLAIPSWR